MSADNVPRHLTRAEIEDIVSVIPKVRAATATIAAHNHSEIVNATALQLSEIKLKPKRIETLKAVIFNRCRRSHIQAGDPVGIQAAEALGQPISQSILNAFHQSGSAEVGANGLQLFQELLNLTRNRKVPKTTIHLKRQDISFREARSISLAFVAPSLKSLLDKDNPIRYLSLSEDHVPSFYRPYTAAMKVLRPSFEMPDPRRRMPFLRLKFDIDRLVATQISISDIAETIEYAGGVVCMCSDVKVATIDIFAKMEETMSISCQDDSPAKPAKPMAEGEALKTAILKSEKKDLETKARATVKSNYETSKLKGERRTQAVAAAKLKNQPMNLEITDQETAGLFLQTCIVPRIENEVFVVESSISSRTLEMTMRNPKHVVPLNARVTALFREVEIDTKNVMDIVRDATQERSETDVFEVDEHRWNFWIDEPKMYSLAIPKEKLEPLITAIYNQTRVYECVNADVGAAAWKPVDGDPVALSDNDTKPDMPTNKNDSSEGYAVGSKWVYSNRVACEWTERQSFKVLRLTFERKKNGNPYNEANTVISEEKKRYTDSARKMIDEYRENGNFQFVPQTSIFIASTYISFTGKYNFVPTLGRLRIHPAINAYFTSSNNFHEVFEIMGLEVARAMIIQELRTIIENSGATINPRHLQMVVDPMIATGTLMPFTARAIVRQNFGAYSDSSFEQALAAFTRSAVLGKPEPVTSTSTATLVGSLIRLGTGLSRVSRGGGYEAPPYARERCVEERDAPTPIDHIVPPHQFVESGSRPRPNPRVPVAHFESNFGSQSFPPKDQDAQMGVLSLRDFLSA